MLHIYYSEIYSIKIPFYYVLIVQNSVKMKNEVEFCQQKNPRVTIYVICILNEYKKRPIDDITFYEHRYLFKTSIT